MPGPSNDDRRFDPGQEHPFVPIAAGVTSRSGYKPAAADLLQALDRALARPAEYGFSKLLELVSYAQQEISTSVLGSVRYDDAYLPRPEGQTAGFVPAYRLCVHRSCADPRILTSVSLNLEHFELSNGAVIDKRGLRSAVRDETFDFERLVAVKDRSLVLPTGVETLVRRDALKGQMLGFSVVDPSLYTFSNECFFTVATFSSRFRPSVHIIQQHYDLQTFAAKFLNAFGLVWKREVNLPQKREGSNPSLQASFTAILERGALGLTHTGVRLRNTGNLPLVLRFQ
ncbi:MAG: hypothetical protein K1X79_00790 [Oligoflexia bacterium]|nr:hypothetical protein [Oligoflexia bacterium]